MYRKKRAQRTVLLPMLLLVLHAITRIRTYPKSCTRQQPEQPRTGTSAQETHLLMTKYVGHKSHQNPWIQVHVPHFDTKIENLKKAKKTSNFLHLGFFEIFRYACSMPIQCPLKRVQHPFNVRSAGSTPVQNIFN